MGKPVDMIGYKQPSGRLTVIDKASNPGNNDRKHVYWLCRCDCGNTTIAEGYAIRNGQKMSCGCMRTDGAARARAAWIRKRQEEKNMALSKQARLIQAIRSAMDEQGFEPRALAQMGGCSVGMIKDALNGAHDLKPYVWQMLCEGLALDYEQIIADAPASPSPVVQKAEPPKAEPPKATPKSAPPTPAPPASSAMVSRKDDVTQSEAKPDPVLAGYLESKLTDDIRHGTDMPLADLHHLLDAVRRIRERGIA
jgi:hypothetical protein